MALAKAHTAEQRSEIASRVVDQRWGGKGVSYVNIESSL